MTTLLISVELLILPPDMISKNPKALIIPIKIMKKPIVAFISVFLLFLSPLLPQENKLLVVAERTGVYLDPDINSPVIDIVGRGTILNLLATEKIQELWYYVSFYSEERFINVLGFIHASSVEMVYEIPEIIEEEKRHIHVLKEKENPFKEKTGLTVIK